MKRVRKPTGPGAVAEAAVEDLAEAAVVAGAVDVPAVAEAEAAGDGASSHGQK